MPAPAVVLVAAKFIAGSVKALGPVGIGLVLVLLVATPIAGFRNISSFFKRTVSFESGPSTVHFEQIAELIVLRVRFADILQANLVRSGASEDRLIGEWIVYGTATYSLDLTKAKVRSIDRDSKSATVIFPSVQVTAAVDHENSQDLRMSFPTFFDTRNSLNAATRIISGDTESTLAGERLFSAVLGSVGMQMQGLVRNTASKEQYISLAKAQAEASIQSLYAPFGWKIEVVWKQSLDSSDDSDLTKPLMADG